MPYEAYGRYTPPFGSGDVVEASGMFSSRDKFFGQVNESFKPMSEVNEQDVRQAAQTECFKKCIFLALGLGKLSEEELKKLGVDTSKADGYKGSTGGKQGGSTDSEEDQVMRDEIQRMCTDLWKQGVKNPETEKPYGNATDVLKSLTKSDKENGFPGWKGFKSISAKGLKISHKQIKEAYEQLNDPLPME